MQLPLFPSCIKAGLLLGLLTVFSCKGGQNIGLASTNKIKPVPGFDNEKIALIANTAAQFPDNTEISIAVIDNEQTWYYGVKRVDGKLKPVDNYRSAFEIGSISKVFTCELMMNAIRDGLIDSLDQAVQDHIEFRLHGSPGFTFRHLASHTSGLPSLPSNLSITIFNYTNPYKDYNREKLEQYLRESLELKTNPGDSYQYSNLAVGLIGYTVGELYKADYESMLRAQILDPLNMQNTSSLRDSLKVPLIPGRDAKGDSTSNWDLAALEGAGAILSTVEDLSLFARHHFDELQGRLAPMRKNNHTVTSNISVGLGWHLVSGYTEKPFVWHNGGTGGYKSSMGLDPESRKSVIILSNISATRNKKKGLIDKLSFKLMGLME